MYVFRILTCVCSFVNLQVFASGKHFSASRKQAGEWFFPGVNSYMIHQLVLRFERFLVPDASGPVASVIVLFRPAHVIHRQMSHHVGHVGKYFLTRWHRTSGARHRMGILPPLARYFLFKRETMQGRAGMSGKVRTAEEPTTGIGKDSRGSSTIRSFETGKNPDKDRR